MVEIPASSDRDGPGGTNVVWEGVFEEGFFLNEEQASAFYSGPRLHQGTGSILSSDDRDRPVELEWFVELGIGFPGHGGHGRGMGLRGAGDEPAPAVS